MGKEEEFDEFRKDYKIPLQSSEYDVEEGPYQQGTFEGDTSEEVLQDLGTDSPEEGVNTYRRLEMVRGKMERSTAVQWRITYSNALLNWYGNQQWE